MNPVFNHDNSYESPMDFDKTVRFIRDIAASDDYPLEKDILVIDIEEGVFVRTRNLHWCRLLDSLCDIENDAVKFYLLKDGDFDEFTAGHQQADQSSGDTSLAVWKQ